MIDFCFIREIIKKIYANCNVSGIKKYIVGLIIKTSSSPELADKEKVYLVKLNLILVQVCFILTMITILFSL